MPFGYMLPSFLSQEYWDSCPEAGGKQRARTSFSEPRPTLEVLSFENMNFLNLDFAENWTFNDVRICFIILIFLWHIHQSPVEICSWYFFDCRIPEAVHNEYSKNSVMAALQQKVNAWNANWAHLLRDDAGTRGTTVCASPGSAPPNPFAGNRTHCGLFSDGDRPVDLGKVFTFPEDCIVPKESLTEFLWLARRFHFFFALNLSLISFAAVECQCLSYCWTNELLAEVEGLLCISYALRCPLLLYPRWPALHREHHRPANCIDCMRAVRIRTGELWREADRTRVSVQKPDEKTSVFFKLKTYDDKFSNRIVFIFHARKS